MNNRTNMIKKRDDTLTEYIIGRCAKLEEENVCMKRKVENAIHDLSGYEKAFSDTFNKMERIEKFNDGSISLGFKDVNGTSMSMLISAGNSLHPLADILFEKVKVWGMKR